MASTQRARRKTQQVWKSFLHSYGQQDVSLSNFSEQHRVHFLEIFAKKYRTGEISKSGKPVRARTVEVALSDIGSLFADLG